MRRLAYTLALPLSLALAALAGPAAAQDYGPPPPPPPPGGYGPQPFTGLHVDGLLGVDRLQNDGHSDALFYGINGGYDFGLRAGMIAGIEVEASDSDNKSCYGNETVADPRLCAKAGRDLYVGGRIGKAITPQILLYAKAGYTNTRFKVTADDGFDRYTLDRADFDGLRAGVGAEYQITQNGFVKAEYRYSNYEQGFSRNQLLGGVGFRF